MNKDRAKKILNEIKDMDSSFGKLSELVHGISDESERKLYAKRLGDILGRIYTDLMVPIIREYPDLDPDK
jgi:hypothetical protein